MKIEGYIVVDRNHEALSLDADKPNHFWRCADDVTLFPTYRDAWNAVKRFRRYLRKDTQLAVDVRSNLYGCRPVRVVNAQ